MIVQAAAAFTATPNAMSNTASSSGAAAAQTTAAQRAADTPKLRAPGRSDHAGHSNEYDEKEEGREKEAPTAEEIAALQRELGLRLADRRNDDPVPTVDLVTYLGVPEGPMVERLVGLSVEEIEANREAARRRAEVLAEEVRATAEEAVSRIADTSVAAEDVEEAA